MLDFTWTYTCSVSLWHVHHHLVCSSSLTLFLQFLGTCPSTPAAPFHFYHHMHSVDSVFYTWLFKISFLFSLIVGAHMWLSPSVVISDLKKSCDFKLAYVLGFFYNLDDSRKLWLTHGKKHFVECSVERAHFFPLRFGLLYASKRHSSLKLRSCLTE